MLRYLLIIPTIVGLSGCYAPMWPVKPVAEVEGMGNVTIIRKEAWYLRAARFWPVIDGTEVAGIYQKQYISVDLPAGIHWLGARCTDRHEREIDLRAKEVHFYLLNECNVEEISSEEATRMLSTAKRINTGYVSDCNGNNVSTKNAPRICFPR